MSLAEIERPSGLHEFVALPDSGTGERHQRRLERVRERRRLVQHQVIVVFIFVLVLAATVLVLGSQWLGSGSSGGSSGGHQVQQPAGGIP